MIYTDFQDKKLSQLGFGTMRLPMADGVIDEAQVADMVRLAMENGVNYFDTAWPYHGGESERVIGRVLAQYPRESWYLATKYPGHQISSSYDPAAIFEEQLRKCGVEYFDFYLLHNVYESSIDTTSTPSGALSTTSGSRSGWGASGTWASPVMGAWRISKPSLMLLEMTWSSVRFS